MADASTVQALGQAKMFRKLSKRDLKSVAASFKPYSYADGQEVIGEGSQGVAFFVVAAGSARVERDGHVVAMLRAGDSFGETALLTDRGARTATVIAESGLQTYGTTSWNFDSMIKKYPAVGETISRSLATQLSDR